MSDDRRKANRPSTGTVPKIKPYNGIGYITDQERSRILTNNLVGFRGHPLQSNTIDNRRRNRQNNYFTMNKTLEEPDMPLTQNETVNFNGESISGNTSATASRRNSSSSALKCDNITKYPDKRQIEHKLEQIREYLKVTNYLMTSMGNTDEQTDQSELDSLRKMLNDLVDSEKKLVNILEQWDVNEEETEQILETTADTSQEMDNLRGQQMALLQLQQKAENKLRQARQIHTNQLLPHASNGFSSDTNMKDSNSFLDFDVAISELEERSKGLRPSNSFVKAGDNIMAKVEDLQMEISQMHEANDEREQLIRTLDNQDLELRSKQAELQTKLSELRNKKMQVDRLVEQMQSFGEEEDEETSNQVRKICKMKEQLKKLKDMLEIVKITESVENTNVSEEAQATCLDIYATAENFLDKEVMKNRLPVRYENDTSGESSRAKQVNKNTREQGNGAGKLNDLNFSQKMTLQNELKSKKRELEEMMGRHKASTSNLNHDVGVDTKSESNWSSSGNWIPQMALHARSGSERFSSDDEYTPMSDNTVAPPLLCHNYTPSNSVKQRRAAEMHRSNEGLLKIYTPEATNFVPPAREQHRSNSDQDKKSQVQKQLQLIKSVCDSMLEQQSASSHSNVRQQLRNNLTPEPRRATVNVAPPQADTTWHAHPNNETGGYQSVVADSAVQMQSFVLNTLNQCCQMLWTQQREIVGLRSSLTALQEAVETGNRQQPPAAAPPHNLPMSHSPYHPAGAKTNHHVAAAYSLPNINHYTPPSNVLAANYVNETVAANCDRSNNAVEQANNLLHANNLLQANNLMPPGQLWNGQALNNQVAPGNRANNYWDNFRSYSRQNLLSTKNIEMLHNLPLDRSNPPNPFVAPSPPKSNSTTVAPRHQPPDVLNVNHNLASEENVVAGGEGSNSKSKLFEELRENVYKEVASLISANESRPHFLIQLFRDLQLIGSDSLRLKILQSIQAVVSHSFSQSSNRLSLQSVDSQPTSTDPDISRITDNLSLQSTVWCRSIKNLQTPRGDDSADCQGILKDVIAFLNERDSEVLPSQLLKKALLDSAAFKAAVKDTVFQKHFSNILDEVLEQYCGKKVKDIRTHLLQTLNELLCGEIGFIQFIQETEPENLLSYDIQALSQESGFDQENAASSGQAVVVENNMQNGDLAEADQTRSAEEDIEEEGAVGGILEQPQAHGSHEILQGCCDDNVEMSCSTEGLDQVPTRLLNKSKSRSATPSRDRSNSRADPDSF